MFTELKHPVGDVEQRFVALLDAFKAPWWAKRLTWYRAHLHTVKAMSSAKGLSAIDRILGIATLVNKFHPYSSFIFLVLILWSLTGNKVIADKLDISVFRAALNWGQYSSNLVNDKI